MLHVDSSSASDSTATAFFKGRIIRFDGAAASNSPRLNLSLDGTDKTSILLNRTDSSLNIETLTSAPIIFDTNNTERARILAAGGLTFNGDTAAANALDDYEEGSAVPDFANADNSIVTVDRYTYTKVGRLVHFEAKFTVGSNSDASGFGFSLPVGQAGSRETVIPAISTRSSPNNPFSFVINANQSYAYAKQLQGYGTSSVEYQDFAGSIILVSGTYEAG